MAGNSRWDLAADVVVLGSGGAALTAAVAAHEFGAGEVVVLEKSGMVGGTTAMSGGMLWIPNNRHQIAAGDTDSWDDLVAYFDACAPAGLLDPDTLAAFLEAGPEMVEFLEDKTPVRLHTYPRFPDYQSYAPGAKPHGSRSLDNDVFPFATLGSWATRVNPTKMGLPPRMSMVESMYGGDLDPSPEEREKSDCRGMGQALIGALLKAVLDRKIPIHFEKRARQLCKEDSRVIGVIAEQNGGEFRVRARKGVVIATGGFEWNQDLVNTFLRGPLIGPVSVPENEGDGLLMAIEAGARLGNMANAWWMMSTLESKAQHRNAKPNYVLCSSERTCPGSIMVNRAGKRFVNEAANYNALGMALHNFDANTHGYPNLPYWLIFDQRHKDRYPVFNVAAGKEAPSWFLRADTIEALAGVIGVDGKTLKETVVRFNGMVRKGHDDDFQRGDNTYDNFWGDPAFEPPMRTLGVLDQPPFYAVALQPGALGTNGGPKTNGKAQVLDWNNVPIEGLYAAGNVMSAVTTIVYGGAGGTLGPGLTFGFVAGRHAAAGI